MHLDTLQRLPGPRSSNPPSHGTYIHAHPNPTTPLPLPSFHRVNPPVRTRRSEHRPTHLVIPPGKIYHANVDFFASAGRRDLPRCLQTLCQSLPGLLWVCEEGGGPATCIYPSLTPKPRQRRTSLSDLRYDNVDAASQIPGAAKTPESVRYPGAKKTSSFPEIHLGPIRS